jgi:PPP family 3-phenylpropionic acid transporter
LTFQPHGRLAVWYFWYFAFIGAFLPYFALYLQSLGFSAGRIAVLMSLGQFMRLLAPLLWSWLADSGGHRVRIVVVSTAASLASFSVVFLTDDFIGLLLGLAILHFFWSASLPLVEALTLGHLGGKPENYGRIRLWGSVGFILTVMGVGLLLDVAPIKSQLWVSWAILFGTLVSALTLTEVKGHGSHPAGEIGAVLRQRKVIYLMASAMLMTAAHGALYVFYSIHLVSQGYGKTLVGFLWTLGVVAEIFVFLWMPRISTHFSLRAVLLTCFCPWPCFALPQSVGAWPSSACWCWRNCCMRRASAHTMRRQWMPSTAGLRRASRRGRRRSTAALPTAPAVLVAPCWPAGCGKPLVRR